MIVNHKLHASRLVDALLITENAEQKQQLGRTTLSSIKTYRHNSDYKGTETNIGFSFVLGRNP